MLAQVSSTAAPWYVPFIPVFTALIGGGIGIIAALGGGWWQSILKERSDRLQRRREKLERFVGLAHELSMFPFHLRPDEEIFPQKLVWQSRIDEVVTLALLHLPEMLPASSMICEASQELLKIAEQIVEDSKKEDPNKKTERALGRKNERVNEAWTRVMQDAVELARRFHMQDDVWPLSS